MLSETESGAIRRLLTIASTISGPQSAYVANVWANAADHHGFDLTDLWQLEPAVADDVAVVSGLVSRNRVYPQDLGLADQIAGLVALWRDAHADTDHAALAH